MYVEVKKVDVKSREVPSRSGPPNVFHSQEVFVVKDSGETFILDLELPRGQTAGFPVGRYRLDETCIGQVIEFGRRTLGVVSRPSIGAPIKPAG